MKYGAENESGVFYATKGWYKGKEVTVTHHDGAMVWLEDYPVGKGTIEYGCWVPNESVKYKEELPNESNKRGSKKVASSIRR